MRKIWFIIAIITFSMVFLGCDNFFTYAVKADEEAVITQGDEIYGDVKGPGVHYKIPFLQKIHIIQKHLIREYSLSISSLKFVKVTILWNVSDSKTYFLFTRSKNDEEVKKVLLAKIENAIKHFNTKIIRQIATAHEKNPLYVDEKSLLIINSAQNAIEPFGIKIDQIIYTPTGDFEDNS